MRGAACEDLFSNFGFAYMPTSDSPAYRLVPKRVAKKISVIIPFRDQPELTCKAVESVISQEIRSDLELILINNQSELRSVRSVRQFLTSVESTGRTVRMIDYDRPFNHSAECNLGAEQAQGECIVFMNNDARLLSRNALVEMAAWSLRPDVGIVGILMLHDPEGKRLSAGITARLVVRSEYESPVQECQDLEFAEFNRQTWGNSFACSAISKEHFEAVGRLDEIDFPNGYNDVDYSIRCRRLALVNIYLGSIRAFHRPGNSRGRCDEIHQKSLLRRKYPEILCDGLFQLALEKFLAGGDRSLPNQTSTTGYLKKISKYLRI
jgi:GT2 family glycosyltransferase